MTAEDRKRISRESYLRNRERVLRRSKERYYRNREQILVHMAEYHRNNPDVGRRSSKTYRGKNQEKCRMKCREWYANNAETERARGLVKNRRAYQTRKSHILKLNKEWRDRNKELIRQRDMRRRALLKGARINLKHLKEWMASVKSKPFSVCYYCDKIVPTKTIHFDHIVALKNGGEHSVSNLCVSCSTCNTSKKDKDVTAWVRIGQQTLVL